MQRKKQKRRLIILGSSVAKGSRAKNNHGWAYLLAQKLRPQNWVCQNFAVGGFDTKKTLERYHKINIAALKPEIVIIGLSISNEGVFDKGEAIIAEYLKGLEALVAAINAIPAKCILGGVYPNTRYNTTQKEYLVRVDAEVKKWEAEGKIHGMIDFMGAVGDSCGHWRAGTSFNAGHPNDKGHAMMCSAINLSLFASRTLR
eukprot:TRINITY_DN22414_c0_g1_i1.p1 TRINITY_DN22414_c0_g1~~TRINITY_DN22414_c0_g1_i1.p1  ORF type:complete len:201 (-),score=36.02 TRINITY_DN22414_c0_g1_i1:5-607(-)